MRPDAAVAAVGASRDTAWREAIPRRFWGATLDDVVAPAGVCRALADWAADPAGRNLTLLGPDGADLTHAAVAACRPSFHAGADVRFVPGIELGVLRDNGWSDLASADLLVIDCMGGEWHNEWVAQRVGALVNRRWMDLRSTVVTTECDQAGLCEVLGEHTWRRLVRPGAVVVHLPSTATGTR